MILVGPDHDLIMGVIHNILKEFFNHVCQLFAGIFTMTMKSSGSTWSLCAQERW